MKQLRLIRRLATGLLTFSLATALTPILNAAPDDILLATLKTKTDTFQNVTVTKKTSTDIFFTHSKGMGNAKVTAIDDEDALRALGFIVEPKASTNSTAAVALTAAKEKLQSFAAAKPLLAKLESFAANPPPQKIQMYAAGVGLVLFLFFSFCLRLVCLKAGTEPGFLVWLPLFQMIPAFRAAQMSGWWFIGLFIPVLNFLAAVLWSFKIAQARGKGIIVGIFLLFPVTNLLAFLYLAFSGGEANREESRRPTRIGRGAAAVSEA